MAFLTRTMPLFVVAALLAAPVVAMFATPVAVAEPITASEEEVKAAFVFRFGSFVEWPVRAEHVGQPFEIAVAGADGIAHQLEALTAERTMHGRPVVVRRLARGDEAGQPDVLFIGRGARSHFTDLVAETGSLPILIVSELEGGIRDGSMIDLVVDGGRVRFDVAVDAAERHGLKISSRVLAIARHVEPGD